MKISIIALSVLFACSSCTASGVKVNPNRINDFTVGKSTCDDVLASLGPPPVNMPCAANPIVPTASPVPRPILAT